MTHVPGFPNLGHATQQQGGGGAGGLDPAISGAIGEIMLKFFEGGSGGLTFDERERLQRQELFGDLVLKTTQGAPSISFSTNQSLLDPRQLELMAQSQANEHFIDLQNLDLARDRARVAEEQGNADLALKHKQLAEQIQARIEDREFRMAQMRQQAQQFSQNMQFQERQAEFSRAIRMLEITENARQFNAVQRQQLMGQIAELSARPGDVVKAEALKQQAGGAAPISQSIAEGGSAITEDSLSQLQGFLDLRDQLTGGGAQSPRPPGSFEAEDRFGFGGLPSGSPEEAAAREQSIFNQTQGQLRAILTGNPSTIAEGTPVFDRLAEAANTPGSAIRLDDRTFSAIPRLDGGGVVFDRAFVVGDAPNRTTGNEETVLNPTGAPLAVIPQDMSGVGRFNEGSGEGEASTDKNMEDAIRFLQSLGIDEGQLTTAMSGIAGQGAAQFPTEYGSRPLEALIAAAAIAKHGKDFGGRVFGAIGNRLVDRAEAPEEPPPVTIRPLNRFANGTGGVFSGPDPNAGARRFLQEALSRLFARFGESGLQIGDRPTPIGVSAPGTSSGLQQIAAATSSAQTGFSPEDFLAEARRLTPTGIRPSIFSRI